MRTDIKTTKSYVSNMPEIILACVMLIPQIVAGILAKSMGRNFWFWFFISFILPIVSLVILLFLKNKNTDEENTGYELADHVKNKKSST